MGVLSKMTIMRLVICKSLYYGHRSTQELLHIMNRVAQHHPVAERYFKHAMQNMNKEENIVLSFQEGLTPYYTLTKKGRAYFHTERKAMIPKLTHCQHVAEKILYSITKDGEPPKNISPLEADDRSFFSSIVSAKDIFRYYVLEEAQKKPSIVMADMMRSIETKFGWRPSRSYIYQLAIAMEDEPEHGSLLIGTWEDPRMRTKRFWRITDVGERFLPRLKQDTADRARKTVHFFDDIVTYVNE